MTYGAPQPQNKGLNFAGYTFGVVTILVVGIPLLLMIVSCGVCLLTGVIGTTETTPSP